MSLNLRLRLLASVGLVMAGLALASISVGCGGGQENDSRLSSARVKASAASRPAPPPFSEATNPVRSVDRTQRNHFALLRGIPERLPPSVRRVLRKPTYGMNWALAQRLPLSLEGSFWLIPGRHVLCLLHAETIHEASSACAPNKTALSHGIVAVSLREASAVAPAERLIVGVVPDGTIEAVVHTGGTTSRVPVAHHLFVLRDSIEEPPDVVSLSRPSVSRPRCSRERNTRSSAAGSLPSQHSRCGARSNPS